MKIIRLTFAKTDFLKILYSIRSLEEDKIELAINTDTGKMVPNSFGLTADQIEDLTT